MVLATRDKGIAYITISGQTQFASMYASNGRSAYLGVYFDPDVAGSFDTGSFDTTGGFDFLYLFDSNGGYLGQGETYSGATDASAVPTAFSN